MENEREVRLRRQIEELVRSRVGVLEQDISRLQREVNESFTRLLEHTDSIAILSDNDPAVSQIAAAISAEVGEASAEGVRLGADIALLRDSVAELDEQRTQAEVLNTLVARASSFAPRVVLFVIKGTNALAWAARGLEDDAGNNAVRGLSISLQSDTALKLALDSKQTFYGSVDQQTQNEIIYGRFGATQPERVLTVALKVRGKPAAVLYADSGDRDVKSVDVEAIELLVLTAGLVVELVSLRTRMAAAAPSAGTARASGSLASSGALPPTAPTGELTRPGSGELRPDVGASGDLRAAHPASPTFFRPTAEPPQAGEPQFAGNAAAAEAASSGTERGADGGTEAAAASAARGTLTEEEKQHNDARRFARLLVSEIKLYNEQKVVDGRQNNDLYDRLKEDIDRSRQMYEKRVTVLVASKFDYFYDELVNTLAEGDAGKLGSDHPGPSVSQ